MTQPLNKVTDYLHALCTKRKLSWNDLDMNNGRLIKSFLAQEAIKRAPVTIRTG